MKKALSERLSPNEIEITPAMIETGVKSFYDFSLHFYTHEIAVGEIYRAMEIARLRGDEHRDYRNSPKRMKVIVLS
jgi:hypothetical protein